MYILINPKYNDLQPFVQQIATSQWFIHHGEIIHDGRNMLKMFDIDAQKFVVKSYGRPTLLNRLLYGSFRKSKATRAYLHAIRLRRLGIDTPEEVAVIEHRRWGLLQASYFIARHTDYRSLCPITDLFLQSSETKVILDALAQFLFDLHQIGVLHKDLNIGNILYKQTADGGCVFQLIDTNRMEFHRSLSMRQRLNNLRRLSCKAPAYLYILQQYAACTHANPSSVQLRGAVMRLLFEARQRLKRKFKTLAPQSRNT